ncbi:hypothetical protein [Paractinoplanes lichenicola]|uniref:Uncharacterized protein n=1 Tax=Paractinoplanes lichenicola TaxID=2802976 RepID=A0ABS1VHS3_9ACTN|nr:hypothetical protein [Actinoplanes lichenicola]MBL7253845.1 hypothetical protein [Actinoplanes lichenicola]
MQPGDNLCRRLLMLAARLEVEQIDPYDVVMLACDFLAEGLSGEATVELAVQSPACLPVQHAEVLLRGMLDEWRVVAPSPPESAALVAVDLSRRILDGTIPAETGGHRLLGALARTDDEASTDRLLRLLDRLEDDLRGRADDEFRAGLEVLAHEIAASAVE